MAKANWGTKRMCQGCGARFYDLRHTPPTCPKCQAVYELSPSRGRRSRSADKSSEVIDTILPLDVDLPDVEGDVGDDVLLADEDDIDAGFDGISQADSSEGEEE